MKKFFVLLTATALLGSLSAVSMAQAGGKPGAGRPGQGQGRMMNREQMAKMRAELYAKLNLTKDQKAKVDKIDKKYESEMKKLMDSAKDSDRGKMRDKFRALRNKREEEFMKVLSKAQQAKYEKLRNEQMEKMRAQFGGGRGPRGGGQGGDKPAGGGKGGN